MPRQKLSEFRAKSILCQALNLPYQGRSIDAQAPLGSQVADLPTTGSFVVKVDEGVKGRFKKGLVELNVKADQIPEAANNLRSKGYRWLIIEPMVNHGKDEEHYLCLVSDRDGVTIQYTAKGGIDVEEHSESIQEIKVDEASDWQQLATETGLTAENLKVLKQAFEDNYFVFMEVNPYVVQAGKLYLLDMAVEVDDAAEFFVDTWKDSHFRRHSSHALTPQEMTVLELDAKSPASFKLDLLEPHGSVFLLLSGGGASVLVADEVYNQGYGKQLANYGEYSGNPNTEETYIYTKALLQLLLQSSAPQKVLFIGGAVANFTDIAKTFAGVIRALSEVADQLKAQQVKVFVRRGGPNQAAGLEQIKAFLAQHELLGAVHDPKTSLTAAVSEALEAIGHE